MLGAKVFISFTVWNGTDAKWLTDNVSSSYRFVYKFVCDLKNLLGYSAGELSRLVLEAEDAASDMEPGTNGGH